MDNKRKKNKLTKKSLFWLVPLVILVAGLVVFLGVGIHYRWFVTDSYLYDKETGRRFPPPPWDQPPKISPEDVEKHAALVAAGVLLDGNDISYHQGSPVNYAQMYAMGTRFAWIRIGVTINGYHYADKYWQYNSSAATDAGIYCGNYYYTNPKGSKPLIQAAFFSDLILQSPCVLPPMIDAEDSGGLSPSELADWYKAFADTVEKRTGRKPGFYTRASFWNPKVARRDYWNDYVLWCAHYFSSPGYDCSLPSDWDDDRIHQWTSKLHGPSYGVLSSYLDGDTYPGNLESFEAEFELVTPTPTPVPMPTPTPEIVIEPGCYNVSVVDGNIVFAPVPCATFLPIIRN